MAGTISGSPLQTLETPRAILTSAADCGEHRQAAGAIAQAVIRSVELIVQPDAHDVVGETGVRGDWPGGRKAAGGGDADAGPTNKIERATRTCGVEIRVHANDLAAGNPARPQCGSGLHTSLNNRRARLGDKLIKCISIGGLMKWCHPKWWCGVSGLDAPEKTMT